MQDRLKDLEKREFDVIIIGGGIAGAGVARDATMRGLSTILFEKGDFSIGTTSKSSKLIHGGLRYLELLDFGLVRESLREREILQRLAPHLIYPLPFLIPVYRGDRRNLTSIRIGIKLYDFLRPDKKGDHYRILSKDETLHQEPHLEDRDLKGAGFYYDDLVLSPERLCLENILSARRHGAMVFNYTSVIDFIKKGRSFSGVRVRDLFSHQVQEVKGKIIVNATGPWVDQVRQMAGLDGNGLLRKTKGIHLVIPKLTNRAIYTLAKKDERMFFIIPWRDFSLIGTTDTDYDDNLDKIWADPWEVDYLFEETRRVLSKTKVHKEDIFYTYAGVRPLAAEEGKRESDISRKHRVYEEGDLKDFLSIVGTKITTYRSMAEKVVNRICGKLGRRVACRTHEIALNSETSMGDLEMSLFENLERISSGYGIGPAQGEALIQIYGPRFLDVLELTKAEPGLKERLCPKNPDIKAQVKYSVENEMALKLTDFMLRRTGIGTSECVGRDCCEGIAELMGKYLGWDRERREQEIKEYLEEIELGQRFRRPL